MTQKGIQLEFQRKYGPRRGINCSRYSVEAVLTGPIESHATIFFLQNFALIIYAYCLFPNYSYALYCNRTSCPNAPIQVLSVILGEMLMFCLGMFYLIKLLIVQAL